MRGVHCAVCGKPIGKHEHRFVERRRASLIARLLRRGVPRDDVHVHSECKRSSGQPLNSETR